MNNNSLIIHPRDHARAVVVLEQDDKFSGFQVILTASATEAAYYLAKSPSLLVWLPAFAQGELRAFTKNAKVDGEPRLIFDLEVHSLSALRDDEGQLKDKDGQVIDLPETAAEDSGQWYMVECPVGSGHVHMKFCPTGEHAECVGTSVQCVPN